VILDEAQIKKILKEDSPLKGLKVDHANYMMHVHGIGVPEALARLEGLENATQFILRKKLVRSNEDLMEDYMSPMQKVFNSQGGSKEYFIKSDSDKEKFVAVLDAIIGDTSLTRWLEVYFPDKYIVDPNGVFLVEHKDGEPYPTYQSINTIQDYKQNGQRLEYIVFEPIEIKEGKTVKTTVRVYDDSGDYTYLIKDDSITLIEEFDNPWGYVPAVLCSDNQDPITEYKKSFFQKQFKVAEEHLRMNSVKTLAEYHHGFPIYWEYHNIDCTSCGGSGKIGQKTCNSCLGTGKTKKKDVSDVRTVRVPEEGEPVIAPNIAGYVVPPIESLDHLSEEVKRLRDLGFTGIWGITINREAADVTAFEVSINTQPMQDKLNEVTTSLENTEVLLVDIFGDYFFRDGYEGASINYGRNYMIKSPNELFKNYLDEKAKGASYATLNVKLENYYDALYAHDPKGLLIINKLIRIEPYIHDTITQVVNWQLGFEQTKGKLFYNEWANTKTEDEIIEQDIEKLNAEFETFLKTKTNDTKQVQGVQGTANVE